MTLLGIFIMAAVIAGACGIVLWYRRRCHRVMDSLNQMLDIAMQGDFTEEHFDETMLSSVETKLAQYLSACSVSARNLAKEKDTIKTLISDISHQTKTPIANVLLYTQLLSEQEISEESRACVSALEVQAQKLQSLIEALVKISRLESGILALHPAPGFVSPVIRAAVSQISPKADGKGIHIVTELSEAEAVFDPRWTEEAIFNLLDNAVKYTSAGGEVRVWVSSYELFSVIHIRDTGPGIPEAEQSKVFQRFYRGIGHECEEGVGVGLYLVRQITQGQGGYVKVTSREGQGSTFSIYLPRK